MTILKSVTVAALLVGGTSLATAQNGLPTGGEPAGSRRSGRQSRNKWWILRILCDKRIPRSACIRSTWICSSWICSAWICSAWICSAWICESRRAVRSTGISCGDALQRRGKFSNQVSAAPDF